DALYAVSTGCGGPADSPWPMFLHDVNHTGRLPNTTPPDIISTAPDSSEADVSVDAIITATFSEVMDPASITADTFLISDGLSNIAGTVTSIGKTAIFTPDSDLNYYKTHTATITSDSMDPDGNQLAQDYRWSFTTKAAPGNSSQNGGGTAGGGCFISTITAK
ncbi:MAG: Ig-like domain-containing protein, partial [Deltaproteobacteria bacterium]|nr:Ig-like domain-containing protein [Deltaproteobacteria bacterium]